MKVSKKAIDFGLTGWLTHQQTVLLASIGVPLDYDSAEPAPVTGLPPGVLFRTWLTYEDGRRVNVDLNIEWRPEHGAWLPRPNIETLPDHPIRKEQRP